MTEHNTIKEEMYSWYKTALSYMEINATEKTLFLLLNTAVMVYSEEEGGNLKSMSKIKFDSEQKYPFIINWSNGSHAANHQI